MKPLNLLFAALATSSTIALAADPAPGTQVEQAWKTSTGYEIPYHLYLPKADPEKPDKKPPVLIFLHGRGESYGPLSIVAKWGPPRMAARGEDLPYILISPQCPGDSRWSAPKQQAAVLELIDHIIATYEGDTSRLYLTGLSMGGYGTWRMAADHPQKFAAAAPVCGAGNPDDAQALKKIPLWVWHGTEDKAVPYQKSVEMVEAIKAAGGTNVRFTTLAHVGHNSWSPAYATPELYSWFNKHSRP